MTAVQTLLAQGILIGPFPATDSRGRSRTQQCNDFCSELVYDCRTAKPVGDMCLILTEPPPRDIGIAIKTPSKAECDDLIAAYPNDFNAFRETPDAYRAKPELEDGWCYQNRGTPKAGVYNGGGWRIVRLQVSGTTITGTYTGTYGVSGRKKVGTVQFSRSGNTWTGTWDDPNIGRGGGFIEVKVSADGRTISGKRTVTRTGGQSRRTNSFRWTLK